MTGINVEGTCRFLVEILVQHIIVRKRSKKTHRPTKLGSVPNTQSFNLPVLYTNYFY